jgi:hypothetical protein
MPVSASHAHLFRFDVATGETTKIRLAEPDAELSTRSRMFVAEVNDPDVIEHGFRDRASFRQVGRRLAAVTGDPLTLTRTNGDEVRLFTVTYQPALAEATSPDPPRTGRHSPAMTSQRPMSGLCS